MAFMIDLFKHVGGMLSPILDWNPYTIQRDHLACLSGPSEPPLLEKTIAEHFAAICASFPSRTAVKTSASALTYLELDQQSDALALGLLDLGVKNGDTMAISLGNCAAYAVISYACFKIGAVVVPLNPAYTSDQVISALDHVEAACFVLSTEIALPYKEPKSTAPLLKSVIHERKGKAPLPNVLLLDNSAGRANKSDFEFTADYERLLSSNASRKLPSQDHLGHNDIATLQFTSGTTSKPKAACLTHRNILNNGLLVGSGMQITEQDIICCPPPLYHCFGLVLGLLTAMAHGACVVLPSEAFDPRAVLRSIEQERPTALYGVPTMFLAELELLAKGFLKPQDFSYLRTGIVGGSPIPATLRQTLHEKLHLADLANCYGLTESSPIVCMTHPSDSLHQKLNTVGQMLPHTSLKIVSRDEPAKTLRRGERGELLIAGYCVMTGYWEDPTRTAEAFFVEKENGTEKTWLRSGDEAMVDEEGYVRITGRIKDIIIRGGENIYPPEIENVLLQHPLVGNASVVGLPDERYGEIIGAFIMVKDGVVTEVGDVDVSDGQPPKRLGAADLQQWVREKMGRMMVPKHVFFVEKMPLTASGKVEKYKLRDLGISMLQT